MTAREQADLFHRVAPFGFDSGATFSADRRYRYRLWRSWGDREHRCVWVMLNPSTADESEPDPTVTKCIGFAKRWGFGGIDVVNLFALVSTDPRGLLAVDDAVGPANDEVLFEAFREAHRVVFAWGTHRPVWRFIARRLHTQPLAAYLCTSAWPHAERIGTLGRARDGSPRHPLMLPYATRFEPGTP